MKSLQYERNNTYYVGRVDVHPGSYGLQKRLVDVVRIGRLIDQEPIVSHVRVHDRTELGVESTSLVNRARCILRDYGDEHVVVQIDTVGGQSVRPIDRVRRKASTV